MTYMVRGKQYLLVAASATKRAAGVERPGEFLIFALPGSAN
jgi:hypothetical protein